MQRSHKLINVASMKNSVVDVETTPNQRKYQSAQKSPSMKANGISNSEEVLYEDSSGTPNVVLESPVRHTDSTPTS